MPTHQRTLIRHAAVALLKDATSAGSRVTGSRIEPHPRTSSTRPSLPAISVYTPDDPVDDTLSSDGEDVHLLELKIVGWVALSGAAAIDEADAIDELARQIEVVMTANPTLVLGGEATVAKCRLAGTQIAVLTDDGVADPKIGEVTLTYVAEYQQGVSIVEALDEFLRAQTQFRRSDRMPDDLPNTDPIDDSLTVRTP